MLGAGLFCGLRAVMAIELRIIGMESNRDSRSIHCIYIEGAAKPWRGL